MCYQLKNIQHPSTKIKMCDEFKNLHWDVPEHQDAVPETLLIHLSLLQNITQHHRVTNRSAKL